MRILCNIQDKWFISKVWVGISAQPVPATWSASHVSLSLQLSGFEKVLRRSSVIRASALPPGISMALLDTLNLTSEHRVIFEKLQAITASPGESKSDDDIHHELAILESVGWDIEA